jgi:hypothetical protein
MALPRVNDTLNFSMIVPSTGKKIKYRPYLVKEEKVLLQAFESGDVQTCLEAMVDTLDACIDKKHKLDVASLATFDVEYMFTQVRSKSVGENSGIQIKCKSCQEPNTYSLDLEELKVEVSETKNVIDINEEIRVEMKYPTYKTLIEGNEKGAGEGSTDAAMLMLAASIGAVLTEEERIDCSTQTGEEMVDFLSSMTASQLKLVSNFLDDMPALKHLAEFDCEKCGEHNEVELKGLSDFF